MISKLQAVKLARTVVGLCLAAGLIYFLYSKDSPRAVGWLITLAAMGFFILSRRAGVYDDSPYFRRLSLVSSGKPLRDLGMAIVCFVTTMAITIVITIAVRDQVLPDNNVTVGFLVVALAVGGLGVLFFVSRVIGRIFHGPPPP